MLLDAEITVISDMSSSVRFAQLEFSQALDSMVDVKICWRIWGICLVSMATKDRPAGRVLWSLDVGEREKSPTSNISNANELFLPSSYSCIGGTMAVIHSGADKIRGLGKSLLVKRGWKQSAAHVLSLSCQPSLLTNHSLLSFSLFKKKAHVLLFKSRRPWKDSLYGTCPTTTVAPSACLQALLMCPLWVKTHKIHQITWTMHQRELYMSL